MAGAVARAKVNPKIDKTRVKPNVMWEREVLWNEPNQVASTGADPEFIEIENTDEYRLGITEPNDEKLNYRR
jgi:hypothetical protein